MQLWLLFSFLAVLFFSLLLPQTTSAEHPMSREHQVARELFVDFLSVPDITMLVGQFRLDQIKSLVPSIAKGQDKNEAYQKSFKKAIYKTIRREIKDEACKYLVPDDSGSCAKEISCEYADPSLPNSVCGDDQPFCEYSHPGTNMEKPKRISSSCGNDQPDCENSLPDTNKPKLIRSACGVCNNMCYEYTDNTMDTCAQQIQGKLVEASDAASSSTSFLRLPIIFALASTSFAIASLC